MFASVSLEKASCGFNPHDFQGLISVQVVHGKFAPRHNEIQNSTPRFMRKWVAVTLLPRDDPRLVRNDELMILDTMIYKIRVFPAKAMAYKFQDDGSY